MDAHETLIRKLCIDCPRRESVCGKELPAYSEAYRCKWDEVDRFLGEMGNYFREEVQ